MVTAHLHSMVSCCIPWKTFHHRTAAVVVRSCAFTRAYRTVYDEHQHPTWYKELSYVAQSRKAYVVCMSVMLSPFSRIRPATAMVC